MLNVIGEAPVARVDYVEIADAETLEPLERIDREALVALAVFVGSTRLIDNTTLSPERT
jgi:pantoate--beta-alanine ligase